MTRFRATVTFDVDVVDTDELQQVAALVMGEVQEGAIGLMEATSNPAFNGLINTLKDVAVSTGDARMQATLVTTVAIRKALQQTRTALRCSEAQIDLVAN